MMGKIILIILLCFLGRSLDAQEFKVHSFRCLPNDITAWVDPVRDLNDEACALIKVVGDPDFVFSTPLGIVSRKNEVGEIWLYVPHGTVKLTIKHPRWGVLRDYRFPAALESRLTYELVIASPPEKVQEMNEGIFKKTDDKNHIGMENAVTRLHMYYGETVKVVIESEQRKGTTVRIWIPIAGGENIHEGGSN